MDLLKTFLYELQPFTREDLQWACGAAVQNARQLAVAALALLRWLATTLLLPSVWPRLLVAVAAVVGLVVATHAGWGQLYLIACTALFIAANLGQREEGSLSAFSVFNPGFRSLAGTFGADQMIHATPWNVAAGAGVGVGAGPGMGMGTGTRPQDNIVGLHDVLSAEEQAMQRRLEDLRRRQEAAQRAALEQDGIRVRPAHYGARDDDGIDVDTVS